MSACRIVRGHLTKLGYRSQMESTRPLESAPSFDAGPAAGVRWDLGDLYAHPGDPALDADLAAALAGARSFSARFRGGVAGLDAASLARAVDELESLEEPLAKAVAYAGLVFAAD